MRELHEHLKLKYPEKIPAFPGKRLFGNSDPAFIRQRQAGLQVYLNECLRIEPDCRTPVFARFLEIPARPVQQNFPQGQGGAAGGGAQQSSGAVAAMRLLEKTPLLGAVLVSACHTDLGDAGERACAPHTANLPALPA